MSRARSFGALLLAALAFSMPARAQDPPQPSVLEMLRQSEASSAPEVDDPGPGYDPIMIPPGQSELQFERLGDVPRQLRRVGCRAEGLQLSFPVRIIRPDRGRLVALVPCLSMPSRESLAFTIGSNWEPAPIDFPVMAPRDGFGTTKYPGYLEWHPHTQTLTATQSDDACPILQVRHVYRYQPGSAPNPFILTKIEYRPDVCFELNDPWLLKWEAPRWDASK